MIVIIVEYLMKAPPCAAGVVLPTAASFGFSYPASPEPDSGAGSLPTAADFGFVLEAPIAEDIGFSTAAPPGFAFNVEYLQLAKADVSVRRQRSRNV